MWKDRATAALGFFSTDGDDEENGFAVWDEEDTDGGWAVTAHGTLIPWAKDQCHFLHVGGSVSYRNPNEVRYRARPGLGRGPRVVDTLALSPDSVLLWNAEIGFVWHSFHASAVSTLRTASFTAAATRSSSISLSSPSAVVSICTPRTSCRPFIVTRTMPPPASPCTSS